MDLPLYGKVFAFGVGLAGFSFGICQIVDAVSVIIRIIRDMRRTK